MPMKLDGRSSTVGNHLAILGGADWDLLRELPVSRAGYRSLGAVLLGTFVLAVGSAISVEQFMGVTLVPAVLIGLVWGAIVLTVNRALSISIRRHDLAYKTVVDIVLRLLIESSIGVIVATPLALVVFQPDSTSASGLVARLDELSRNLSGNPEAQVAYYMFVILLVVLQMLPVLVKALSLMARRTDYEIYSDTRSNMQRVVAESKAQIQADVELAQLKMQLEAGRRAAELLVEKQVSIARRAIEIWSEAAEAKTDSELARWLAEHASGETPSPVIAVPAPVIDFGSRQASRRAAGQ